MSLPGGVSRRDFFVKIGIFFNGIVGVALAVPIVRYLLSPVARERKPGYESWIPLGNVEQFPSDETRLATYRNPVMNVWDGDTADIACWVRNVDGQTFQVFAINCAHLGCPVRWFPQSSLFMCPCHGGAYYQDGSRASGPPERGLFEYEYCDDRLIRCSCTGGPEGINTQSQSEQPQRTLCMDQINSRAMRKLYRCLGNDRREIRSCFSSDS